MKIYACLRPLLFKLDPERAHQFALRTLAFAYRLGLINPLKQQTAPTTLMGLSFPNKIGLSAGFDRNGEYIKELAALGFGFIEIGTIVPKPQTGNKPPRIFRLVREQALINRVGFASKGLDYVVKQLEKTHYTGILGINIGKNKDTPNEKAIDDYLTCFQALWKFASYITLNLSSPNTAGLRDLLKKETLIPLLRSLKQAQHTVFIKEKKYVPLVIKLSPDLAMEDQQLLASILVEEKIDGIISANTTILRDDIADSAYANEVGGLSGQPLLSRNLRMIANLRKVIGPDIPIIASGGIMNEQDARNALLAGANLLQVYTGLIYQGPGLISCLTQL